MSDVKRWLKKKSASPEIRKVERGEQAEGIAHALEKGRGDIVAGTKALGLKRPGLAADLAKAKRLTKPAKGKKR